MITFGVEVRVRPPSQMSVIVREVLLVSVGAGVKLDLEENKVEILNVISPHKLKAASVNSTLPMVQLPM